MSIERTSFLHCVYKQTFGELPNVSVLYGRVIFRNAKKPSRFLAKNLSDLVIRCDYDDRGCPEVVVLANLKTHLVNCEFSPVQCSNEGCTTVINKRERIHHETQTCQFRRCANCRETREDIGEIKLRLQTLEVQMSQMLTMSSPQKALEVKEDIIVVDGRNKTRLNSGYNYQK